MLSYLCQYPSCLLVKVKGVSHSKQELDESSSIQPPPPPPLCRKDALEVMLAPAAPVLVPLAALAAVALLPDGRLAGDTGGHTNRAPWFK